MTKRSSKSSRSSDVNEEIVAVIGQLASGSASANRILGLLLIVRAIIPIIIVIAVGVAGFTISQDLFAIFREPVQAIQTEFNTLQTNFQSIQTNINDISTQATDISAQLQQYRVGGVIPEIPSSLAVAGFTVPIPFAGTLENALSGVDNRITGAIGVIDDGFTSISNLQNTFTDIPNSFGSISTQFQNIKSGIDDSATQWIALLGTTFVIVPILLVVYLLIGSIDNLIRGWKLLRASSD